MDSIQLARTELPRFSLTPDDAAASTGFSKTRIFQAIRNGELTARKDGKATVVETDELLRWLRSLPTRGRRSTAHDTCVAQSVP
jgi:excisionase family DNA binding protein